MRYQSKSHYSNWNQLIDDAKSKNIWQDKISVKDFLDDIETVKRVSHKNIFSNQGYEGIIDDLNQISSYDPDYRINRPELTGGYAFISDLHRLANLIREAEKLPNINKLFNANIFSHEGMYLQFQLTVYLSRYLKMIDVELKNSPINSDILFEFNKIPIHFSVKDCREEIKKDRNEDIVYIFDGHFSSIARNNRAERFLAVKNLDASPPAAVPESFWLNYISGIKEEPQELEITFDPNDWPSLTNPVIVKIGLEWREWNSTHRAPTADISNETKVSSAYNSWEKTINKSRANDEVYVIATITDDEYEWDTMESSLDEGEIGLFMVSLHGFYIQHSNIMFPSKYKNHSDELRKLIPAQPYWKINVMKKI